MTRIDPAWIARTLAENDVAADASPGATVGRVGPLPGLSDEAVLATLTRAPEYRIGPTDREPDPRSPDLFYRGRLGEGGMGIVDLAYQPLLNREVAIKRLATMEPGHASLLLREARITGSLEHANITPIHALVNHPEFGPLVVMKRIQGVSWEQRLHDERPRIAADENVLAAHVEILSRVCQAVEYAHSRGILHRDLKPANVMLGEYGELYVVDWGLAVERGAVPDYQLVGSPAYMPPEMATGDGRRVDERADVYLLGATLHEIVTGAYRHGATSVTLSLAQAVESPPHEYGPEIPEELARICNRACAREVEDRYPGVAALREALLLYLEHRRAAAVLRSAVRQHERLRSLLAAAVDPTTGPADSEVSAAYQQAIVCYEQALDIWDGLTAARSGRERAMIEMLVHALDRGDIHGAARIAGELAAAVPSDLRARLDELIAARQATHTRLTSLEAEVDLRTAAPARRPMVVVILLAVCLMNLGFFIADPTLEANAPASRLLVLGVVLVAIAAAFIITGWRRLTSNIAGRQYIRFVAATVGLVFLNRIRGYLVDDPALTIFSGDLLIAGATLCVVRLPLPGMVPAGLVVAGLALATAALPSVARLIFLVTTTAIPLTMIILDRLYRSSADRGAPAKDVSATKP